MPACEPALPSSEHAGTGAWGGSPPRAAPASSNSPSHSQCVACRGGPCSKADGAGAEHHALEPFTANAAEGNRHESAAARDSELSPRWRWGCAAPGNRSRNAGRDGGSRRRPPRGVRRRSRLVPRRSSRNRVRCWLGAATLRSLARQHLPAPHQRPWPPAACCGQRRRGKSGSCRPNG